MDCFGAYFTHVQTCNVTRVQSATEWTRSHKQKDIDEVVKGVVNNVVVVTDVVVVLDDE